MFPLSPTMWAAVGGVVLIAALSGAVKVQTSRLATAKAETVAVQAKFDTFVSQAKAIGDAQEAKAKALDAANHDLKEKVDAESAKSRSDLAILYAKYVRVRNSAAASANSSQMPPAAAVTSSTSRTCFDTAKLTGAMGILEAGVPRITEQGDGAIIDLNAARGWAQRLKMSYTLSEPPA